MIPSASDVTIDSAWSLHPQLSRDTIPVGDLWLSRVLPMNDARYPWLLLVPRRDGVRDSIDLDEEAQAQLAAETAQVSRALRGVTACDKLNVAALGNVVPQLHVHIIARRIGDAAWPQPVWGAAPPLAYEPDARAILIQSLRRNLGIA